MYVNFNEVVNPHITIVLMKWKQTECILFTIIAMKCLLPIDCHWRQRNVNMTSH